MSTELVPDLRAVVGAAVTLTYTHRDYQGEPAAPGGTPTVAVVDAAGDTVTAGSVGAGTGTGVYTASVAASENTQVDTWTVTWTADSVDHTQTVSIVGGVPFDTATFDQLEPSTNGQWTTAEIIDARERAVWEAENITGRTMVQRHRLYTQRVDTPVSDLLLPDRDITTLRAVTTTDTAGTSTTLTADQRADLYVTDAGYLVRRNGTAWPAGQVQVSYVHGFASTPEELVWALARRTRWFLNRYKSGLPDRVTSWTTDEGSFRLDTRPDRTGDAAVDAIYGRWRKKGVMWR